MAWTTPTTVNPGDAILSSLWNEQVRDNSAYLKAEADAVGLVFLGGVSVTSSSTLDLTSVFSSDFNAYRVIVDGISSGSPNTIGARMLSGTTPNTTASSYSAQSLFASSTTVSATRFTSDYSHLATLTSTAPNTAAMDIFNPFLAVPTGFISLCQRSDSQSLMQFFVGTHNQSVSYDGLRLFNASGGTMTASATVYGYRKA